jgi:uncharacterized glyoxalase superfamily protein PhnB
MDVLWYIDDELARALFLRIASGGEVKMPVGDYGFSACLGWATDRCSVSWQISRG